MPSLDITKRRISRVMDEKTAIILESTSLMEILITLMDAIREHGLQPGDLEMQDHYTQLIEEKLHRFRVLTRKASEERFPRDCAMLTRGPR
jgi:hypothetical protein